MMRPGVKIGIIIGIVVLILVGKISVEWLALNVPEL